MTFTPKPTNEFPENTIINQSRAAGTTIVKGATLKIVYAVKYEEETVTKEENTEEENENTESDN